MKNQYSRQEKLRYWRAEVIRAQRHIAFACERIAKLEEQEHQEMLRQIQEHTKQQIQQKAPKRRKAA